MKKTRKNNIVLGVKFFCLCVCCGCLLFYKLSSKAGNRWMEKSEIVNFFFPNPESEEII